MTDSWQLNGVHREVERRDAHFAPGADPTLQADPLIEEVDEHLGHAAAKVLSLTPPKPLIIAAATVFAATAFFMLRSRRKPARWGGLRPSSAEKSLLLRGIEKGGLSLIALAVQRLGTRGLDHWLGSAEALPEAAKPERQTPAVGHAE
jgi:hypothetical protein